MCVRVWSEPFCAKETEGRTGPTTACAIPHPEGGRFVLQTGRPWSSLIVDLFVGGFHGHRRLAGSRTQGGQDAARFGSARSESASTRNLVARARRPCGPTRRERTPGT